MFENYSFTVAERFMRYVQVDTQSDPHSNTYPSTEKQKDLSRILVKELLELGLQTRIQMSLVMYMQPFLLIPVKKCRLFVFVHILIRPPIAAEPV